MHSRTCGPEAQTPTPHEVLLAGPEGYNLPNGCFYKLVVLFVGVLQIRALPFHHSHGCIWGCISVPLIVGNSQSPWNVQERRRQCSVAKSLRGALRTNVKNPSCLDGWAVHLVLEDSGSLRDNDHTGHDHYHYQHGYLPQTLPQA